MKPGLSILNDGEKKTATTAKKREKKAEVITTEKFAGGAPGPIDDSYLMELSKELDDCFMSYSKPLHVQRSNDFLSLADIMAYERRSPESEYLLCGVWSVQWV